MEQFTSCDTYCQQSIGIFEMSCCIDMVLPVVQEWIQVQEQGMCVVGNS